MLHYSCSDDHQALKRTLFSFEACQDALVAKNFDITHLVGSDLCTFLRRASSLCTRAPTNTSITSTVLLFLTPLFYRHARDQYGELQRHYLEQTKRISLPLRSFSTKIFRKRKQSPDRFCLRSSVHAFYDCIAKKSSKKPEGEAERRKRRPYLM